MLLLFTVDSITFHLGRDASVLQQNSGPDGWVTSHKPPVAANLSSSQLVRLAGKSAVYVVVLVAVVRPLLRLLIRRMSRHGNVAPQILGVLAAGAFLAGYVTNEIGLDAIFGAFSFGLVMPRDQGPSLQARVRVPMEHVTAVLLPVFFVSTGLAVDVTALGGGGVVELLAVIAVGCLGKVAGATGAARWAGLSWRDARAVGFLMNTRGLTELIILDVGLSMGVLDGTMFTIMVVMALVTTAMAGPLVPKLPYARTDVARTDADRTDADRTHADRTDADRPAT